MSQPRRPVTQNRTEVSEKSSGFSFSDLAAPALRASSMHNSQRGTSRKDAVESFTDLSATQTPLALATRSAISRLRLQYGLFQYWVLQCGHCLGRPRGTRATQV